MNKKELVTRIAQSTGLTQAQVARALDSTIHLIREELIANAKPNRASRSTIPSSDKADVAAAGVENAILRRAFPPPAWTAA